MATLYRPPTPAAYNPYSIPGVAQPGSAQTISEKDLGGGIDAKSAENQIPQGKVEDLLNGSTNAQGTVRKRNGYMGYAGTVPLRVLAQAALHDTEISFRFDTSVDLSGLPTVGGYVESPIIVAGKTAYANGSGLTVLDGDGLPTLVSQHYPKFRVKQKTTLTAGLSAAQDLGLTTQSAFVEVFTDAYELVYPNLLYIDSTNAVKVGISVAGDYYLCGSSKPALAGTTYVKQVVANTTVTVPASEHNLSSEHLIIRVYDTTAVDGVTYERIIPDSVSINNGDVTVTLSAATTFAVVISAAPYAQFAEAFSDVVIPDRTSPFTAFSMYERTAPGVLTEVIPTSAIYNAGTLTIAAPVSALGYVVFYEDMQVLSNTIAVDVTTVDAQAVPVTDMQLTVWGVPDAYSAEVDRLGFVNHVDSYIADDDRRMICGLGGNLYAARTQAEVGSTYRMPTVYPRLSGRVDGDQTIGPAIWDSGDSPSRVNYIKADNGDTHWLGVTAVTWLSGTSVQYTVHAPNYVVSTSLAAVFNVNHPVTVVDTGHSVNAGVFYATAVGAIDANTFTVTLTVPARTDADYDEVDCGARLGIFADSLTLVDASAYAADDYAIVGSSIYEVLSVSGNILHLGDLVLAVTLVNDEFVGGRRTSNVIPVQSGFRSTPATDFPQIVVGDQLLHSGYSRYLTVTAVDIADATVTIDEALEFSDTLDLSESISVPSRWIPIEIPYGISDEPRIFDARSYSDQQFLRSATVNDSMFFTDGENVVRKFDGYNVYRAGLLRWSPGLFLTKDTAATGKIDISSYLQPIAYTTYAAGGFTTAAGVESSFTVGDTYISSNHAGVSYTITAIDTTAHKVYVSPAVTVPGGGATSGTLQRDNLVYSYYFRLNAVDANNNIVASAACGSAGDYTVKLAASSAIHLKLLGLPSGLGDYDYTRVEVEIYRTKIGGAPPYYRIATIPVSIVSSLYIDYTDTASDDTLSDLDMVNSALLGQEVGTTWTEPPLAAHITSLGNRLVLGNITDYPKLDMRFIPCDTGILTATEFEGVTFALSANAIDYEFFVFTSDAAHKSTVAVSTGTAGTSVTLDFGNIAAPPTSGWVYTFRAASSSGYVPAHAGWYRILSHDFTDANHKKVTIDCKTYVSLAAGNDIDACVYISATAIPVWLGTDYNIQTIAATSAAVRLNIMRRLAEAINARWASSPLAIPFYANAGGDFESDQIVIRSASPAVSVYGAFEDADPSVTFKFYVNGILQSASGTASYRFTSGDNARFGSRILLSYPNFPEIFDSPTVTLDKQSDSAIDINPADGQVITGVIPFFGLSAFGAAMTDAPLLVFKTRSVYVVDVASKQVKKLETRGLGCSYPYSIGSTRKGIIFANESGIYRINRDLSLDYVGFFMERKWLENTERGFSDLIHGHHFAIGSEYKLSVPLLGESLPSEVYVYDHTREDDSLGGPGQGTGAWARHDNIPSLGWANLEADEFYARPDGRVFVRRRSGTAADYRDDASAITFRIVTRPMDFGNQGIRKAIRRISSHFRTIMDSVGTTLWAAVNLSKNFQQLDTFVIDGSDTPSSASNADEIQRQQAAATQYLSISNALRALSATITAPEVVAEYNAMIAQAETGYVLALKSDPTGLVSLPPALDDLSDVAGDKMVSITSTLPDKKCQYLQLMYENSEIDEGIELAGIDFRVTALNHGGMVEARDTRTR